MSRIALYDVDLKLDKRNQKKFPNLAIMKLSAYHKSIGDTVEPYNALMLHQYDKIYASKVFDFSDGSNLIPEMMEIGGTGWDINSRLSPEVEAMAPDYSFYKYEHSIGFTMRGCRFNCSFCVVPQKEGRPKSNNKISEIWTNRESNFLVLLDNDFFGNPEWEDRIEEIKELNLKVNFSQGLNIRIITEEQARALASVRFSNKNQTAKQVYFAWDKFKDEKLILKGFNICVEAGIKPRQMAFFILVGYDTTPAEDMHRIMMIRNLGCDPFVMPIKPKDPYQNKIARWVNDKAIFKSVEWENYDGR